MGRIVINKTEDDQTVILNSSPEEVTGGYFDKDMNWTEFGGSGGEWSTDGLASGTEPTGDIILGDDVTDLHGVFKGSPITSFRAPKVTAIHPYGAGMFQGCANLKEIRFDSYTASIFTIAANGYPCAVEKLIFPKSTNINAQSLVYLPSLKNIAFPAISGKPTANAFVLTGTSLEKVDFGSGLTGFDRYSFTTSSSITDVVMRTSSVVSLWGATIVPQKLVNYYVPSALVESYKTTGNWKTVYDDGYANFIAIEGSPYENYYVDGEPVEV